MQYPSSVKGLAEEIKKACDDYFNRKIDNDQIREIISWYASSYSDKLFVGGQLNTTITKIIGKSRTRLLIDLLKEQTEG